MTVTKNSPGGGKLEEVPARERTVILPREKSADTAPVSLTPDTKIRVGMDPGTVDLVLAVLDESRNPITGE